MVARPAVKAARPKNVWMGDKALLWRIATLGNTNTYSPRKYCTVATSKFRST